MINLGLIKRLLRNRRSAMVPSPPVSAPYRSVLNVGGGSKQIPIPEHYAGWTHLLLDVDPSGKPDIVCDARSLGTLQGEQFDAIYCSHNLEHYYKHDGATVLRGFLHLLKPDGFAEIRVPDLKCVMKRCVETGMDIEDVLYQSGAGPITVRDVIYGWGKQIESSGVDFYAHKTGFTRASLAAALDAAGFGHVLVIERHEAFELCALAFKSQPTAQHRSLLGLAAADTPMSHPGARKEADQLIERGHADEAAGNFESAYGRYLEARLVAPDYPRVHINIGNVCRAMGRLDEALTHFRMVEQLAPDYPAAHNNLGALFIQRNEHGLAEAALRRALELDPLMVDAAVMLADLLDGAGRSDEAEAQLRRVVVPGAANRVGALVNLGLLLAGQHRVDEARQVLEQALVCDAGSALAHAAMGALCLTTRRHADAASSYAAAVALQADLPAAVGGQLFLMNFRDDVTNIAVFEAHRAAGLRLQAQAGGRRAPSRDRIHAQRRLRIGYVSGDFGQHPVGLFIRPVLQGHDLTQFDLYCYANGETRDDLGDQLRRIVPNWRSIMALGDTEVAALIARDEIDILVDLAGHTAGTRVAVFAYRPAPVQVSWLGYLNTTGLPEMDYRLCDHHTDPVGETESLHTEKLLRLAHSQWCYAPVYEVPLLERPHANAPDQLVFGSFNQFAKISDACIDLWCRLLRLLPAAQLRVFDVREGSTRVEFLTQLARRGVDSKRVRPYDRMDILEYFRAIGDVDIALDTLPYNGATTTLDVLWMGVPVVALRGQRAIARGGFSILSSLGLPELIARSEDEYVEFNVRLAGDPARRQELRRTLRARLEASPLMDATGFVRDLEDCYRMMWQERCGAR